MTSKTIRIATLAVIVVVLSSSAAIRVDAQQAPPFIQFEPRADTSTAQKITFRVSDSLAYTGVVADLDASPERDPHRWVGFIEPPRRGTFSVIKDGRSYSARVRVDDEVITFTTKKGGTTVQRRARGRLPCLTNPRQTHLQVNSIMDRLAGTCDYLNLRSTDACYDAETAMAADARRSEQACETDPPRDRTTRIDVMVAYTPAVKVGRTHSEIVTNVEHSIDETTLSFDSSNIAGAARLAARQSILPFLGSRPCVFQVDYAETGSLDGDLFAVQHRDSVPLSTLDSLRAACRADVVLMLVETADGSGMACVMKSLGLQYRPHAFAVVRYPSMLDSYVFTHELGHMLGAGHERTLDQEKEACRNGMCRYSAGHHFDFDANPETEGYASMMAYGENDTLHFSDPNIRFEGGPRTGTDRANNARTLRISMKTVAEFY